MPAQRPPWLVLRFAVYAGVALALVGAGSVLASRQLATDRAEERVSVDARHLAEDLGRDDLARGALAGPATGDVLVQLDELFDRRALGPGVERVSVLDRKGVVTYSTDHSLIGTRGDARRVEAALAGDAVVSRLSTGGSTVLRSHVPVQWLLADPTWSAGVLAVDRDWKPVADEIADEAKLQAAAIVLALMLLYLSLFPILARVTGRLRRSEASYRTLTEQASDAILVLDPEANVIEANRQAAALLGGAVVGAPFASLVDPDELAREPLRLAEVRAGLTLLRERTLVRADGSTVATELHAKALEDGRILSIVRDVTDRKEAERATRRLERAEATTRLASGVAHDFTSLLTAIAGNSDLIIARLPDDDPLRRKAELIQEAAARGTELTRQLGAFGRRVESKTQVLETAAFLRRLEPSLRRLVGERTTLALELDPALGHVQADPREFEQLLVGLVLNAEAALPTGGAVAIAAANVDFVHRQDVRVDPGAYVMLSVRDDGGTGGEGRLGLELATVFAVVQRGGGTMSVESDPLGTTTRVYLPRVAAEAEEPPPVEAGAAPHGHETILVVEDEGLVRALVCEILEEQGYRLVEAANGADALALVQDDLEVDLVVTDLLMPGLGGAELARELERLRPSTPVIAMSAAASADLPGLVFLQKPFTHETLARTVRDTLDTRLAQPAPV